MHSLGWYKIDNILTTSSGWPLLSVSPYICCQYLGNGNLWGFFKYTRMGMCISMFMCAHIREHPFAFRDGFLSYLVCASFHSASPAWMFRVCIAGCGHACLDVLLLLPSSCRFVQTSCMNILGQNEHWLVWEGTHALHPGAKS